MSPFGREHNPAGGVLWVSFYKAGIEHNKSAIPPELSVKTDIAVRQ